MDEAGEGFWGGAAPLTSPHEHGLVPVQPASPVRTQRSLPGPAGRISAVRPAVSTSSIRSGGGCDSFGGSRLGAAGTPDPDFVSRPWLQALQEADVDDFDEQREPFKGNTVRVAAGMQESGTLDRLLAVVVTVKHSHSGEAFVRLKDPTGTIGGTLTRAVLDGEPAIRQGAAVFLRCVTVLRTPPPCSLSHLCIALDSVLRVVPASKASLHVGQPGPGAAAMQQQRQQQQPPMFPALPAPPASSLQPIMSRQQLPAPALAASQPSGVQGAFARHSPPQQTPAPSASFAWPSMGAAPAPAPAAAKVLPPHPGGPGTQRPPASRERQQPTALKPTSSSFAWPSIGTAAAGALLQQPAHQMPPPPARLPTHQAAAPHGHQQQPAMSESVNFSMPTFCKAREQTWQDDASSLPSSQQRHQTTQHSPPAAAATAVPQQQSPTAPTGWLQGLLAEADFDPFAHALLGSQASQQPTERGRAVLAERQSLIGPPQQQPPMPGSHAAKRQCTNPPALPQQQPVGGAATCAVFGEVDDLELEMDE